MKFINNIYSLLLTIFSWFINIFKPTVKVVSPSVWEIMANKRKAMSPVLWKRMIHKLKSKQGQKRQLALPLNDRDFKHFGTFSACKPFKCNHKTFS